MQGNVVVTKGPTGGDDLTDTRQQKRAWQLAPPEERHRCSRGLANLLTMAIFNIITDVALIILPFPMLRHIRLDKKECVSLGCFMFSAWKYANGNDG